MLRLRAQLCGAARLGAMAAPSCSGGEQLPHRGVADIFTPPSSRVAKWPISWAQNKILPTLQGQYYDWKIRSSLSHPLQCGSVTLRHTPHHEQSSVWSIHKAVFTRVFCADGAWTARRISTALWTISFHFVPDRSEMDWKILLIQTGLCRETPYLCTGQNKWKWGQLRENYY